MNEATCTTWLSTIDKNTESLVDVAIREPRVNKIRLSEKAFTVIFKKENYVGSNNIYCISIIMCAMIDNFSRPLKNHGTYRKHSQWFSKRKIMSDLTTFIVSQLLCALWLIILAGLLKITVHTPKVNRFFSIETFPLYVNYKTLLFFSSDSWPSLCLGHRIEQKNKVYRLVCGPLSEVRGIYSCIKKLMLHFK